MKSDNNDFNEDTFRRYLDSHEMQYITNLREYKGTIGDFMNEVEKSHRYIEVQLWYDEYCIAKTSKTRL